MKLTFLMYLGTMALLGQPDRAAAQAGYMVNYGDYGWKAVNFGACNAPSMEGKFVDEVFFYYKTKCYVYKDPQCKQSVMNNPLHFEKGFLKVDIKYDTYKKCFKDS